jgi:NAD-dependent SIR2 family protein deacetylase
MTPRPLALLVPPALLVGGLALAQAPRPYVPREDPLPGPEVRQPVAFSHRVHAEKAALECLHCHEGATRGDAASLPQAEACLVCHASTRTDSPEVGKLVAAAEKGERLAWVRVYRVPDFVFFGHREHLAAGARCSECHGPVETRDALRKEVSTSMTACLDCHRRREAPLHCVACHVLGH